MSHFLKNIQEKPRAFRVKVFVFTMALAFLFLFSLWLGIAKDGIKNTQKESDNKQINLPSVSDSLKASIEDVFGSKNIKVK